MPIDLRKIQIQQAEWSEKNFGPQTPNRMILGITEELGELCHAELKNQQGIRVNENHEEKMKDAVGDIVIYLLAYCNEKDFNIETIIKDTWMQVKLRDWRKNRENGDASK